MIQEYLFLSDEKLEEVKKYRIKFAKAKYEQIKNTSCWIVSISINGDTLNIAKILSEANDYIVSTFQPVVITNGCASFLTKALYPLAADFERNLRRLLYLKSSISKSQAAKNHIKNLEDKNLDEIRSILFYDKKFYEGVHQIVSNKKKFEKREILSAIGAIDEKTVWDTLFPDDPSEYLKKQFSTIMDSRNDIMHSHNINYEVYEKEKALFEETNREICSAIDDLMANEIDIENALEFDQSLGEAIQAQNEELEGRACTSLLYAYINNSAVQNAVKTLGDIDSGIVYSNIQEIAERYDKVREWFNSPRVQSLLVGASERLEQLLAEQHETSQEKTEDQQLKDNEKTHEPTNDDESKGDKQ